jgi:uncharacterized protein YdiU (UPF0061 family)
MFKGFTDRIDNTFVSTLTGLQTEGASQFKCREIRNVHYATTIPEKTADPNLVVASKDLAKILGLDPEILFNNEGNRREFARVFSGNQLLPGFRPYASIYGCHCYGTWFGQLGDGRAQSITEVVGTDDQRYELQLKGCGRSPFSRAFDGRAVLRSSVREFLASESMYHLGVETTRALSLVVTGDHVRRPWYGPTSGPGGATQVEKYPPDMMTVEKGAITTRVAKSFLRFAQLELFAKRGEKDELLALVDYAVFREYPELLSPEDFIAASTKVQSTPKVIADGDVIPPINSIKPGDLSRYVDMYRKISEKSAQLVIDWLRVGYTQGNCNSDNTLVGGRTLDYGPFGFVELYDPLYQPFTSDQDGKFAFMRQPSAMHMNLVTLSEAFDEVIKHRGNQLNLAKGEIEAALVEINKIVKDDFPVIFQQYFDAMRARKLGLVSFSGPKDNEFYSRLDRAMYRQVDFTMFFRLLSQVKNTDDAADAMSRVEAAFYDGAAEGGVQEWIAWFDEYLARLRAQESVMSDEERSKSMNQTNPKFVLRNWMGTQAYEAAESGDYSLIEEIYQCLRSPYDEQSDDISDKYFLKTPSWAKDKAGVAFFS